MSPDSKPVDLIGAGDLDAALEMNLDLSPSDPAAIAAVKEIVRLALKIGAPLVGEITKSVAALGGWLWQPRKTARAKDFLLGLYQRLETTRSEYVRHAEFADLFEETLRRIADQPEVERRQTMQTLFLRIIDEPREHVENRLLVRLADELPSEALKALAALPASLTTEEQELRFGGHVLTARMGYESGAFRGMLKYLVNENLLDEYAFEFMVGVGATGTDLMFLLTPLGRAFVEYGQR